MGANPERLKQYGLPAEGMNTNRPVLLCANVRDPRKTQIRYDWNGHREMAMKGEDVTFLNLHLTARSGNDIQNCDNFCNIGRRRPTGELFLIRDLFNRKVAPPRVPTASVFFALVDVSRRPKLNSS
jgi:hypothetical protein